MDLKILTLLYRNFKKLKLKNKNMSANKKYIDKARARTGSGYKPFKMKGHELPGINQKLPDNLPDGRSSSSPFQLKSPTKWVQAVAALAPVVMDMVGKLGSKNKEK